MLTYQHWRSFDSEARALTLIYNICFKAERIPKTWKTSKAIFIPKGGDPMLAANWRPIALSSTIYKLYASLITRRLTRWMDSNGILSSFQKGFRPFNGAMENNYAIEPRINEARRLQKAICTLLIDIKNAFGCLPYEAILEAYRSYGVGHKYLGVIKDLYTDNFTQLLTSAGLSDLIPIILGVKQGCPASGPTYNITVNPLYPLVLALHERLHILGYMDDTVIVEDSPAALQATLDKIVAFARKLGLSINPDKCRSIHISPPALGHVRCQPTIFNIEGENVQFLSEFKTAKYLGKPVGFNILDDIHKIDQIIETGEKILTSNLAPWQALDALKSFFFQSLNYAMRMYQYGKEEWKRSTKN